MSAWIFKLLTRQAAEFEPGSLEEIEPSEATAWLSPLYVSAAFKKKYLVLTKMAAVLQQKFSFFDIRGRRQR